MRSTGTVTCSDLEAESSAVFSTVMELIVGGIYPDVVPRVNLRATRHSLHFAGVAESSLPCHDSAALPVTPAPLGDSILSGEAPSCTGRWRHPVAMPGRVVPNAF